MSESTQQEGREPLGRHRIPAVEDCPVCGAAPGEPCTRRGKPIRGVHVVKRLAPERERPTFSRIVNQCPRCGGDFMGAPDQEMCGHCEERPDPLTPTPAQEPSDG